MKTFISVSKAEARRFLLATQFLYPFEPCPKKSSDSEAALRMIRRLECVQLDPVSVVERNQHLVLAARIPGYRPEHLYQLLSQGEVFEYIANAACVIPIEDYPIFNPIRDRLQKQVGSSLKQVDQTVTAVLAQLKRRGPLPSRAFKSDRRVYGYWDNNMPKTKETSHALNLLLDAGIIRIVRRAGNERFFDLTETSVPKRLLHESEKTGTRESQKALIEKYIRAYRLFDPRDARFGWQKMSAAERRAEVDQLVGEGKVIPMKIENVKRDYFIMHEDVSLLRDISQTKKDRAYMEGPVRFLPPLDNLLWRRERVTDLFDFDYKWEIYTPSEKRAFGPYAMPILYGDQLIGRMDPSLDRKNDRLVIRLLQLEQGVELTTKLKKSLRVALENFACFHQVDNLIVERTEPKGVEIL
ncbi:hypothetical protein EV207_10260 [Scopulibacillus darangshiensis]|uniref:Winged helix-turn-helix domain-containing protein n=1 Tax=Scopulibacillus darangshiensis TaxID=442528 RepID=A0A4R2PBR4_9BACL|nr:crosslink repair DNA glycosylase YcaQ family protein [Scopulibacillus darangshiensis]TCP31571.1 hypothetical protein EV207_10260 [Scopulibacillus darangshiensis]